MRNMSVKNKKVCEQHSQNATVSGNSKISDYRQALFNDNYLCFGT